MQNNDLADFRFDEPEFDQFYEMKVTRMFKWSTVLAIVFLYPQVIVQALVFYNTDKGGWLSKESALLLTTLSDFLNLLMFILTPFVYFTINVQFRREVKQIWREKVWPTRVICDIISRRRETLLVVNMPVDEQEEEREDGDY
ncbi:uncharacterized protein LOC134842777 [Symsagittifera roscoffensis]|uniref:uncharacterized protein LOC134842777 n=1 Tax=Symsagittifera roscoffensis TaxID=84072 RepID=UPI00307C82A4